MPASADAQNFAGGQVQFTATGTFSQPPSPSPVPFVAPYSGGWQVSNPVIATINQTGLAQCTLHASGTVTVTAIEPANSCADRGCMSVAVLGTTTPTRRDLIQSVENALWRQRQDRHPRGFQPRVSCP